MKGLLPSRYLRDRLGTPEFPINLKSPKPYTDIPWQNFFYISTDPDNPERGIDPTIILTAIDHLEILLKTVKPITEAHRVEWGNRVCNALNKLTESLDLLYEETLHLVEAARYTNLLTLGFAPNKQEENVLEQGTLPSLP